jgi:hypothetical protein
VPGQRQVLAAPLLQGRAPVVHTTGDQVAECLEAIPSHPLREVMKGGALLIGGGSLLPGLPDRISRRLELPAAPSRRAAHRGGTWGAPPGGDPAVGIGPPRNTPSMVTWREVVPRIRDSPDFDPSSLTPSASLPCLPLALAGNFNVRLGVGTEPMEPLAGRPPGPDHDFVRRAGEPTTAGLRLLFRHGRPAVTPPSPRADLAAPGPADGALGPVLVQIGVRCR